MWIPQIRPKNTVVIPEDSVFEVVDPKGGTVLSYHHKGNQDCLVRYAHATSPVPVKLWITVNKELIDIVYIGAGVFSWWQQGATAMLRRPLKDGDHLEVQSDGPCALRIDWELGN